MASLTNLRQLVTDVTRDPNNRIFPIAIVDRAINSAYMTIQQELENFIDTTNETYTTTTIGGQQEYTLPSNFLKLQTVVYNGIALLRTTKKKIVETDQNTTTGSPIYYYIHGGNLGLYPIPNQVQTITLTSSTILPTITDTEDSEAPELLDSAIAYKAVTILFKQIGKPERELREQEYQSEINMARLSLLKDENLTYRKVGSEYLGSGPRVYDYGY